jgi:hypothetical protein
MSNAQAHDRKVRRLISQIRRGKPATLRQVYQVCPYHTVLGVPLHIPPEAARDVPPDVFVAVLGFFPEDFSERMRADILTALRSQKVVRLMANNRELRDYAKREILLALANPNGSA